MSGSILRRGGLKDFHPVGAAGNPVHRSAEQVRAALRRQAGPAIADMLAFPKRSESGNSFDWYAPFAGNAVAWTEATEVQRVAARPHIRELREALMTLSQRHGGDAKGQSNDHQVFAALLPQALKIPDESHAYLVDGRLVLVFWGFTHHGAPDDEDVLARMLEDPSMAPPVPVPPPVALAPVATQRRRFSWWWLLWLLLLLFLLLGLWWWWGHRDALQLALGPCPDPVKTVHPVQEVMLAFDVSGSMLTPANMDPDEGMDLMNSVFDEEFLADTRLQLAYLRYGESRLNVAKSAVSEVVDTLPADVSVGLVLIGSCDGAESRNVFAPDQRALLQAEITALESQGRTPLAQGVAMAADMINGRGDGSLIVVVSDGQDSCNGDPCAVARQIARNKSGVRINVVDIGNVGAGNCLAEATGGRVVVADSTSDLRAMIRQAANPLDVPAHCKK